MLTNKDNEIRTADIPERFQVCDQKLIIIKGDTVHSYFGLYKMQFYYNSNSEMRAENKTHI